jgi:flagellar biosynthesis/type III secretory pathway chaperone
MVISQNQKFERKRIEITRDMATVLNQKESELTMSRLIELMEGQAEQQPLILLRDRIKETLDALTEINKQNGALIENALDYLEYSTNVLRNDSGQPAVYSSSGEVLLEDEQGIIDKKN